MSQRLGMADGRCFTISAANSLLNDYMMKQQNINYEDNYAYRKFLQQRGPAALKEIEALQTSGARPVPRNSVNQCQSCDTPLLKMSDIY